MIGAIDKTLLTGAGLSPSEADTALAVLRKPGARPDHAAVWSALARDVLRPEHPFRVHQALHQIVFTDWDRCHGPAPAWFPHYIEQSNIGWLMRHTGIGDYDQLYRWSIREPKAFWDTMTRRLGVVFKRPYDTVFDDSDGVEHVHWLVGAKLNIVASCFCASDDSPAIVYRDAHGASGTVTVAQLRSLVGRVVNGFHRLGLQPGDRIGMDMIMTVESVAIYLGAIACGLVAVTVADSFAPGEIAVRFRIAPVKCVFTQVDHLRAGKRLPLYDKIKTADAPRAIVLKYDASVDMSLRDGDLWWDVFLAEDHGFDTLACDPDDPTNVLFSSGTTGDPKAIAWDHVTPIKSAIDGHLHHDVRQGDVIAWPTSLGWMMGPWLVYAALMNRATIALYYDAPTTRAFGQFVRDAGVTMLGLVPSIVAAWKTSGCLDGSDWSAIRAFSSTGECSNPADMQYLMSRAGYKPIIEYCGGTEIGGGYITGTVVQPSSPGMFSTPALGSELIILDEDGAPADKGELLLAPPAMGLSQTLLNADHHEVYHASAPAGPNGQVLRRHGDHMQRLPGGYYRAHGRVDDTMNLGGIKVSSRQLEDATNTMPGVKESAAIAVAPPDGGPSMLVVYVVPADASAIDPDAFNTQMQQVIRSQVNPLFRVHDVVVIDALPRTASNKVMRRVLRERYERQDPDSASSKTSPS